jgi:hypothetical protein
MVFWKLNRKRRSLTQDALHPDLAAVGFYDLLRDEKPEPQAACVYVRS